MQKYLVALALILAGLAVFVTARQTAPSSSVKAANIPALIIGKPTAKLTVVVYGDFRSQKSQLFASGVESEIKRDFVDSGQVKIEWHNFAESSESQLAAQAARCANDQNFFPAYHDLLISTSGTPTKTNLEQLARQANDLLNETQFDNCLESGQYSQTVKDELQVAEAASFDTTTYVIGQAALTGLQPYSIIKPVIEAQL